MKRIIMAASAAAVLGLAGCITTDKNDGGDACLKPAIAKDIVHEKYTVQKNTITASESLTYVKLGPISFSWGGTATHIADKAPVGNIMFFGQTPEQKALNGAFANACDQASCDTLVGARYRYTLEDYLIFGKVTCEATGYPSKLTGVELIENKSVNCGCAK